MTYKVFGYTSIFLTRGTLKKIYAICDECHRIRLIRYATYLKTNGRCHACSKRGANNPWHNNPIAIERMRIIGESCRGIPRSEDTRAKIGIGNRGKTHTEHSKIKMSSTKLGIPVDEWVEYGKMNPYSNEFTERLKAIIRDTYDNKCFICGMNESDNCRKMSIHHINRDKLDTSHNNLIPLCVSCHSSSHTSKMEAYLTYIINDSYHETHSQ